MGSVDSAKPAAEGNLASTPFLHLVLYLYQRRTSGTLLIHHQGRETKVLFRDGRVVAARPLPRGSTLQPGLLPLCALEDAPYTFWEEDLVEGLPSVIKGTVDPHTLVTDSLRGHVRDDVVNGVVDRYLDVPLVLTPDAAPRRLGLRGQDSTLLDLLSHGPVSPQELLKQSILPRNHVRRLLYALLITKCLAPADSSSGSSGVRKAVTISPPWSAEAASAETGASGRVPRSPQPQHGSGSPPRVAGPSTSVPPPGQVPAWKSLATLRPPGMPSSRPPAASSSAPPRVSTKAARPLDELDDDGKFRRVEQLVESRNLGEARRVLEGLMERHPRNADYLAMRAWLLFSEARGPKLAPALVDAVNEALRADEANPRAHYTKGMMYKRLGRNSEAMRQFKFVVELDPKHLAAKRELRLMEMRKKRN